MTVRRAGWSAFISRRPACTGSPSRAGHWIDVVDGEQLVKSKDFSGSRECARPHKIVEFELPANKDLVLQFSGATDSAVTTAITRSRLRLPTETRCPSRYAHCFGHERPGGRSFRLTRGEL